MPAITKSIDVHVPVHTAYDQWTQFEEFPRFMEGVRQVEQVDDTRLHWVAEVAGREVEWDAKITEQEPDRKIAWRSTSGVRNDGAVEFEPLGEDTTRVQVEIDHDTDGLDTQAADALGIAERRVEEDLTRFRELIESRGEPSGAWRGEIHGGKVTMRDRDATIGPEGYSEHTRLPSLGRLSGMEVRDADGEKAGKVDDILLDKRADHVRYITVKAGMLDGGGHVVPIDDVTFVEEDGDEDPHVVVPYSKDQLKGAPTFDSDDEMTPEKEQAVYDYYNRVGYWDETRLALAARQTPPAPIPEIAEAEMESAAARGDDPRSVRVKRWGI